MQLLTDRIRGRQPFRIINSTKVAIVNAFRGAVVKVRLSGLRSRQCLALVRSSFIALLLFGVSLASGGELAGRVVGVLDGDTLEVLTAEKRQIRVRLAGIDAPEKRQPFGSVSKKSLSDLAFGKMVTVEWSKVDRYGRTIGKVIAQGNDVNLAMVQEGFAWHYKAYAKEQSNSDQRLYTAAEERARASHLGLWRDAHPIAPWEFRHLPRARSSANPRIGY